MDTHHKKIKMMNSSKNTRPLKKDNIRLISILFHSIDKFVFLFKNITLDQIHFYKNYYITKTIYKKGN